MSTVKTLGQIAYEAATEVAGKGGPWDEAPQLRWEAAAEAVRRAVIADGGIIPPGEKPEQRWHVCWFATFPGRDPSYGDGIYTVAYGFTEATLPQLRSMLAEEMSEAAGEEVLPEQIGIMGLTRIE